VPTRPVIWTSNPVFSLTSRIAELASDLLILFGRAQLPEWARDGRDKRYAITSMQRVRADDS
jgi:hypothetical protein